MAGINNKRK